MQNQQNYDWETEMVNERKINVSIARSKTTVVRTIAWRIFANLIHLNAVSVWSSVKYFNFNNNSDIAISIVCQVFRLTDKAN